MRSNTSLANRSTAVGNVFLFLFSINVSADSGLQCLYHCVRSEVNERTLSFIIK